MLFNNTTDKLVIHRTKLAVSFKEKLIGLMFEKPINFNYALVFIFNESAVFSNSIHSFFVFFPFLAVYLNEKRRVVDIKIINPNQTFQPKEKSKYLIEMPVEFKDKIHLGDSVEWI